MKIVESTLALQASHERTQQRSVRESLHAWVDKPAAEQQRPPALMVTISAEAKQKQAGATQAAHEAQQDTLNDPKLQLLIQMIERITGQKVKLFDLSQLHATGASDAAAPAPQPAQSNGNAPRAGFGLDYRRTVSYSESERTSFQASGVIHTADGKEINFQLDLSMLRQYSETSSTRVLLGDAARKTDPLVLNYSGKAAELTNQRFAFDLNADGTNEQINFVASGSGFLALDKNGNGQVDNGSELFGPTSGNGYSELAQYDSDHNGWIDESDAVYQQLKVWSKDASGNDSLQSLSALGVGALSLQALATPFDIKNANNELLGSVRASSVALNEDGSVASLQQIDLTA